MPALHDLVVQHREAILLGEFGGLLHMFGKASSEFLRANSSEGGGSDTHQDLRHLAALEPLLRSPVLRDRFAFTVGSGMEILAGDFTDFITKYKGSSPDSHLIRLFRTCHRMTSADEKGVVRRKQSIQNMQIITPFGRVVRAIPVNEIDDSRKKMEQNLAGAIDEYLRGNETIDSLRERAVRVLRPGMSVALGETREPANDVTLWAQSSGVASLYKSCLAGIAMGSDPCPRTNTGWDYDKVRWRLLGIGWNGLAFLQRGRKAADILRRREIIGEVREQLRSLLEVTYPVGNLFYADLNGAFFTFPGIDQDSALVLMDEIAPELVRVVREASDNELWPFFTLSRPRRTLTAVAREIRVREELAAAPCMATLLSIDTEQSGTQSRIERLMTPGPSLPLPLTKEEDVCPVCRFRSKPTAKETCQVCQDRRRGRQKNWFERLDGETIWVDEIADANNRMALLTLRFDLSRWLSGEWFTTIFTQTFDEWFNGNRTEQVKQNHQQWRRVENIVSPASAGPNAATATSLLHHCVTDPTRDPGFKASLLRSFFEDIDVAQQTYQMHLDNLRGRISETSTYALTAEDLARLLFTQNPSAGRLARVWEAAEDFIECMIDRLRDSVFSHGPERLGFQTTADVDGIEAAETYRIVVPELEGGPLVVLALSGREFLTIDCLEKFRWRRDEKLTGIEAAKRALTTNGIQSWREEATGAPLAGSASVEDARIAGRYLPFAVLAGSPAFFQLLLPAKRVPDVLRTILDLEEEHFAAVRGKLVLHAGVLVAKRKFPLYALIEAGQQILNHPVLSYGSEQDARFAADRHNDFYRYYATEKPDGRGHPVTKLSPVTNGRQYWLTNGYFDFDFLGGTVDRHRLQYRAASPPLRPSVTYGWLQPRPITLFRLRDMFEIWRLLCKVSPTQRHQIEAALSSKLEQWRAVGDESRAVFEKFARAVLSDGFGEKSLPDQDRQLLQRAAVDGLLLDTIQFFEHVVKGEVVT